MDLVDVEKKEAQFEQINGFLEKNFFGWYFNDNGNGSYFLSVFNSRNFSEELIFSLDYTDPKENFVKTAHCFHEEEGVRDISRSSKNFSKARKIAKVIYEKFLQ